jgi:putative FmdB family regulatory protein
VPIYDYVCGNCGERTEVMHPVHAPGPDSCLVCGGPLRKALSPPAIVFKGSGWAKKDARNASSGSPGDGKVAASGSKEGSTDSAAKQESSTAAD